MLIGQPEIHQWYTNTFGTKVREVTCILADKRVEFQEYSFYRGSWHRTPKLKICTAVTFRRWVDCTVTYRQKETICKSVSSSKAS